MKMELYANTFFQILFSDSTSEKVDVVIIVNFWFSKLEYSFGILFNHASNLTTGI